MKSTASVLAMMALLVFGIDCDARKVTRYDRELEASEVSRDSVTALWRYCKCVNNNPNEVSGSCNEQLADVTPTVDECGVDKFDVDMVDCSQSKREDFRFTFVHSILGRIEYTCPTRNDCREVFLDGVLPDCPANIIVPNQVIPGASYDVCGSDPSNAIMDCFSVIYSKDGRWNWCDVDSPLTEVCVYRCFGDADTTSCPPFTYCLENACSVQRPANKIPAAILNPPSLTSSPVVFSSPTSSPITSIPLTTIDTTSSPTSAPNAINNVSSTIVSSSSTLFPITSIPLTIINATSSPTFAPNTINDISSSFTSPPSPDPLLAINGTAYSVCALDSNDASNVCLDIANSVDGFIWCDEDPTNDNCTTRCNGNFSDTDCPEGTFCFDIACSILPSAVSEPTITPPNNGGINGATYSVCGVNSNESTQQCINVINSVDGWNWCDVNSPDRLYCATRCNGDFNATNCPTNTRCLDNACSVPSPTFGNSSAPASGGRAYCRDIFSQEFDCTASCEDPTTDDAIICGDGRYCELASPDVCPSV